MLQETNKFQGECKLDSDCYAQFGSDYKCFIDKQQCYYCSPYIYASLLCEGQACRSDESCALRMCNDNICAFQESSSMFWTIIFYIVIGLIACVICIGCAICGEKWWKGFKKRQIEKKLEKQARNTNGGQIFQQILESMKLNNQFTQVLQQSISENVTIEEYDYFQNQTVIDVITPVEYRTQNIQHYITHFSNQYGTFQKAHIQSCSNYYNGGEYLKACIIKKTVEGQKVEFQITAKFYDQKLDSMQVVIVPLLSFWQLQKKLQPVYREIEAKYRLPPVFPQYHQPQTNDDVDNKKLSDEQRMRRAIQLEQEAAARRCEEYERQQKQFRENIQKQEQDYWNYYRK